jgi:hypothetical protein
VLAVPFDWATTGELVVSATTAIATTVNRFMHPPRKSARPQV